MAARKAVNTNRQGANFELQIMKDLSRYGYTVMRSSGSKGVVDVHAVGDVGVRLYIQAKITNPLIPPAERTALLDMATRGEATPLVAYREKGTVLYRILLGPEPRSWTEFVPKPRHDVICGECDHKALAHAELGCWELPGGRSCFCAAFVPPEA